MLNGFGIVAEICEIKMRVWGEGIFFLRIAVEILMEEESLSDCCKTINFVSRRPRPLVTTGV